MSPNEPPRPIAIVLADDDEDDCLMTREAFTRHRLGDDFHVVGDGEELLRFLRRQPPYENAPRPGLVLLDLNMPRMDGREALREIRADPALRDIPVVVLTTSGAEEDILRTYALGANSYVRKPVGFDSLVRVVGDLGTYWFEVVELPPNGR
jgi:CheY-like chemotaxis protein